MRWELDSHFELAVRKPTKLISLPLMHLVVGLEERGNFVRYSNIGPSGVPLARYIVRVWKRLAHTGLIDQCGSARSGFGRRQSADTAGWRIPAPMYRHYLRDAYEMLLRLLHLRSYVCHPIAGPNKD